MRLSFSTLLKQPIHFLAFGFGAGLMPQAPGTFGTLVAVPVYLLIMQLSLPVYLMVVVFMTAVGVWVCGRTSTDLGVHDHGGIVWDEMVGYLVTLTAVPPSWWNMLLAFVLFRLFDIAKPWPISWVDRRVSGGLGIMIDDIIAALFALPILHLINYLLTF
ncbi:MAG TPA: phosphatidylglycerophosphatase A [Gammaproteobacteria bacterium]